MCEVMFLKIIIEDLPKGEDDHIVVRLRTVTPEFLSVLTSLKSNDSVLVVMRGDEIFRIPTIDIFYIESVDNKAFVYTEDEVYESKQKLYELEELLPSYDFLRISKSFIVNLRKIESLAPALSGRLEAKLANGERVIISRNYVKELKLILGI